MFQKVVINGSRIVQIFKIYHFCLSILSLSTCISFLEILNMQNYSKTGDAKHGAGTSSFMMKRLPSENNVFFLALIGSWNSCKYSYEYGILLITAVLFISRDNNRHHYKSLCIILCMYYNPQCCRILVFKKSYQLQFLEVFPKKF